MFLNAAKGAKNPEKTNALNSSKKNDESVPGHHTPTPSQHHRKPSHA